MQELDDNKFDAMIRAHVKRKLDPMTGLTVPAVLRWNFENPAQNARTSWKKTAGIAAAACLLGLILSSGAYLALKPTQSTTMLADGPVTTIKWWENYDAGTVMVDNQTPARLFERVQFEKTSRTLPDGSIREETTIPRRDLILVDYPTQ